MAVHLFSAQSLHFHVSHFPYQVGLSTYLFIMGELIDAWQNRNIHHVISWRRPCCSAPVPSTKGNCQQANCLAIPSTISVANIGYPSLDETPVCDALMKRLAGLVASGPNKTSGIDQQVQHIGHYVVNSTSIQATQKATLQDVSTAVSTVQMLFVSSTLYVLQKFISQRVIAFRLL